MMISYTIKKVVEININNLMNVPCLHAAYMLLTCCLHDAYMLLRCDFANNINMLSLSSAAFP